ncbi:MAG: cell division protein ZipA C-terminal FtsZ-binding domain-containing protein, partial [Pseudomonadales bacterium]
PGTFNLEDINSFRTPGVTFFMTLPGPEDALQAFECMVETANCLVKNLNALLLDEDHSTASLRVINHYRARVKQFNQKMNSALESA